MKAVKSVLVHDDGGLTVEYLDLTTDVRSNGVVLHRALHLPPLEEFDEVIDELLGSIQRTLEAGLGSLQSSAPWAPVSDISSDDEAGPYDNPLDSQ